MHYDRMVIGYHGCSAETAEAILAGHQFKPSANDGDWLGAGIYFWEYGLDRAWQWAAEHCKGEQPAVVGAIIQLGKCFDLMDTNSTHLLRSMAEKFVEGSTLRGETLPANRGRDRKLRGFDCAIINWAMGVFDEQEPPRMYQCIRGGFSEGGPLYKDNERETALELEMHIQIAVRDPSCIIGTFRPTVPR